MLHLNIYYADKVLQSVVLSRGELHLKISTFVVSKKAEDENRVDQREPQIKHRFFKPSFWKKMSDHMLVCHFKNGQWQEAEIRPWPIRVFIRFTALHYGKAHSKE